MANSMCPVGWAEGAVMASVDPGSSDGNRKSIFGNRKILSSSEGLYLFFGFPNASFWGMGFCTKRVENTTNVQTINWPKGSYCIFRANQICPNGFSGTGSLVANTATYYHELHFTTNMCIGTVPDHSSPTKWKLMLQYCCRDDGPVNKPLILPTEALLVLLPIGKICQQVHGMSVNLTYVSGMETAKSAGWFEIVKGTSPSPFSFRWTVDSRIFMSHVIYLCEYYV